MSVFAEREYQRDDDGFIDDPDFDGSPMGIADHYRDVHPVYRALHSVDGAVTNGFVGNFNWYVKSRSDDGVRQRAKTFARDFDAILEDVSRDTRSMYVVTSWKDPDAVYTWAYDPEGDFGSGAGLANHDDIRAFPAWVDGDLIEKKRRGEFSREEKKGIERDIEHIIETMADMYDVRPSEIAVFDSGGGMYPWGPATATLPIAPWCESHEDDLSLLVSTSSKHDTLAGIVFEELGSRIKAHLNTAIECEYFDADAGTNKNRQSKAPLSLHSSHDILVTPARDGNGCVDYSPTLASDMDDDLMRRTIAEVNKITTSTACQSPQGLIETLWPGYSGDWGTRLLHWLISEQRDVRDTTHTEAWAWLRRQKRTGEKTSSEDSGEWTESDVTPYIRDVYSDVEDLDLERVCEATIVEEWTDEAIGDNPAASGKRAFIPTWRKSSSGSACYVDPNKCWEDTKHDGVYGTAIEAALIAKNGRSEHAGIAESGEWKRGVESLRELGFDIRRWIPEAGSEHGHGTYDQTPEWAIREYAYAGGHDPDDDVWRSVRTGEIVAQTEEKAEAFTEMTNTDTQRSITAHVFNYVIDKLADEGIDHQRTERDVVEDFANVN